MVLTIAKIGDNIINVTERMSYTDVQKIIEGSDKKVLERYQKYIIEVETPGFDKKDIKIELDDGYLRVSAEKSEDEKNSKKKYYRRERHSYTKCERQFYVGDVSDSDIKAEFRNGVLRLSVPKSEEKKEQKKLINID